MFHENSYIRQSDTWHKVGQGISGAVEKFSPPEMLLGPFLMPNPDQTKMSQAIEAIADMGTPLPGSNMFEKVKVATERMTRMTKAISEFVKSKGEAELEKLDGMGARLERIEQLESDNKGLRLLQTKDGFEVIVFSVDQQSRTATMYSLKFDPVGNIKDSSKYIDGGVNQGNHKCSPSEVFKVLETLRPTRPPA